MNLEKKINQGEREEIIKVVYPHALIYWPRYILAAIILFPTIFFASWLLSHPGWGVAIFVAGMVLSLNLLIKSWFFSTHNALVITSERLVDIDRPGWFAEKITTLPIGHIEDVSIIKKGVLNTLLNLGNILIIPRDDKGEFEIMHVRQPQQIERIIWEAAGTFSPRSESSDEETEGESEDEIASAEEEEEEEEEEAGSTETELDELEERLRKLSHSDLLSLEAWLKDRLKNIKH